MKIAFYFSGWSMIFIWGILSALSRIGVTILQAEAGTGLFNSLYPLSNLVHMVWYKIFGTGELQLRILGLLTVLTVARVIYGTLADKFESTYRWVLWLTTCSLPGLLVLGMNHLPELWSLIGFGLYLNPRSTIWLRWSGLLILGLTSQTGFLGMWGILIYEVIRKKSRAVLFVIPAIAWTFVNMPKIKNELQTSFVKSLSYANLGAVIDAEQKDIYLSSQNASPQFRLSQRIVFNKLSRAVDLTIKRSVEVLDPTMWSAPLPAWVITGISGIPTKAVWPIFYFWQILLVIASVVTSTINPVFAVVLLPVMVAEGQNLNAAMSLMLLPGILFISKSLEAILAKTKRAGRLLVLAVFGLSFFLWLGTINTIREVQKLDLIAYREMYDAFKSVDTNGKKFIITDRLGPTEMMFTFYQGRRPEMVEFGEFDWIAKNPSSGIYMGFTKEFTGSDAEATILEGKNGKVLARIELPGEVVHKYGKDIWVIER